MKTVPFLIPALATLALAAAPLANADENEVVLPDGAQECVLPAGPDPIPEDAGYDELVATKGQIAEFQEAVEIYRSCLAESDENPDLTPGNRQAIANAHNYSVEMEEGIAQRFNEAIRSYKARKAAESE